MNEGGPRTGLGEVQEPDEDHVSAALDFQSMISAVSPSWASRPTVRPAPPVET
jgi:hypothetical protein